MAPSPRLRLSAEPLSTQRHVHSEQLQRRLLPWQLRGGCQGRGVGQAGRARFLVVRYAGQSVERTLRPRGGWASHRQRDRGLTRAQKTNFPRNTPKIRTIRKITTAMKNSTLEIDFAPEATPLKPKKPATTEMRKKMMAHFSMIAPRKCTGEGYVTASIP